jgi:RecB family exonuclease
VAELFPPGALAEAAVSRPLAAVTWDADRAPTEVERARAAAVAGPRRRPPKPDGLHEREVLDDLAERREFSAGALETYAGCGVKWVVERLLDPLSLEPDAEQMVRGQYAHAVLKLTFERLRERTGERRVAPENLAVAEEILLGALREKAEEFRLSPKGPRVRALARRLEFDLVRHLRHEAESGSRFVPQELELAFGMAREGELGLPALELEEAGIRVRGRIDRVDTDDGRAVVRDYKGGRTVFPVAGWEEENRLQAALYMLAVREVLGLEPVAGLYVPLGGTERAPRGVVSAPWAEAVGADVKQRDLRPPEEVGELLERAKGKVRETVARLRRGEARPCPATCDWRGRCAYPPVCREEGAP